MTEVVRIVTHVIDPVPRPPLDGQVIRDVQDGMRRATRACGGLLAVATVEHLLELEESAGNAMAHCLVVWRRYARRFDAEGEPIGGGRAPFRLFVRFTTCEQEWEWRRDLVRQLLVADPAGSA